VLVSNATANKTHFLIQSLHQFVVARTSQFLCVAHLLHLVLIVSA
jgi:hypothetical protein